MKEKAREYSEQEKLDWKLDPETSFAELAITPIKTPESQSFRFEDKLEIRPYPNPIGTGGWWGTGGGHTLSDLKEAIRQFHRILAPYQARGLTSITIVKRETEFRAQQRGIPPLPSATGGATKPSVRQKRQQLSLF